MLLKSVKNRNIPLNTKQEWQFSLPRGFSFIFLEGTELNSWTANVCIELTPLSHCMQWTLRCVPDIWEPFAALDGCHQSWLIDDNMPMLCFHWSLLGDLIWHWELFHTCPLLPCQYRKGLSVLFTLGIPAPGKAAGIQGLSKPVSQMTTRTVSEAQLAPWTGWQRKGKPNYWDKAGFK